MNLYEEIISIEPELAGRIILAVREWNPNASFVNEKLIENTWDNSKGLELPTAAQVVTAWGQLKAKTSSKSAALIALEQAVVAGFTSAPLPSLSGKTLKLKVTEASAMALNLRASQLREALTQGVKTESDTTFVWDYSGNKVTLSIADFFSMVLPFGAACEHVMELQRAL
jgi:hypothetical protein